MTGIPKADPEAIQGAVQKRAKHEQARRGDIEATREETADRIAARIVRAANKGNFSIPVRGGRLGLKRTEHGPDVYERVAEHLGERGMKLAVHSVEQPSDINIGITIAHDTAYQMAQVTRFEGQATNPPFVAYSRGLVFPPQRAEEQ